MARIDLKPPAGWRGELLVVGLYVALFVGLFAQFPLGGALPGNCDTWLVIALSNSYAAKAQMLLAGDPVTSAMFPVANQHGYGESSPGCAAMFLLFKLFGFSDVVAYYLYICLIFVLTAYGVFRLARYLTGSGLGAFFAGLAFTWSNFAFANIDDSITLFYLLPALAVIGLLRFVDTGARRPLIVAAVLGGLQVYFSAYVFVFQTLFLAFVLAFHAKRIWRLATRAWLALAVLVHLAITVPFFAYYLYSHFQLDVVNPFGGMGVLYGNSLGIKDLFRTLPGNPIYPELPDRRPFMVFWALIRKHAFLGVVLTVLAAIGLRPLGRNRVMLAVMGFVAFFLSLGPFLQWEDAFAFSPLYYVYDAFPFLAYLRVPLRAFSLTALSLSLLAAFGVRRLVERIGPSRRRLAVAIVAVLCAMHALENVALPLPSFPGESYADAPAGYTRFFESKRGEVVLDLPTEAGVSFDRSGEGLFFYNREVIYMNWQTQHRQNTVNGVNGYYPARRLRIQYSIDRLPHVLGIAALCELGVTYFVYHKSMELPYDRKLLPGLERTRYLTRVHEDEEVSIFEIDRQGVRDAVVKLYGTDDLAEIIPPEQLEWEGPLDVDFPYAGSKRR